MESLGCATLAQGKFQFLFALRAGSSNRCGPAILIETKQLKSLFAVQD